MRGHKILKTPAPSLSYVYNEVQTIIAGDSPHLMLLTPMFENTSFLGGDQLSDRDIPWKSVDPLDELEFVRQPDGGGLPWKAL